MQIKNIDGSITDTTTGKTIFPDAKDVEHEKHEDIKIIPDHGFLTPIPDEVVEEEKKDPFEQWKLAEKLINMPSWELKYRFGYDSLKYIINEFDYNEIFDIIEGKDKEELFNQGDIIKIADDDLYYAVVEMIGTPNGDLYLVCMHCAPTSKFFSIGKNTKSIRLCGKPIKVKIDEVSQFIAHAKHIKLGW